MVPDRRVRIVWKIGRARVRIFLSRGVARELPDRAWIVEGIGLHKMQINHAELSALAEQVLQAGKQFSFSAYGSSMSPFIRDGDIVFLEQPSIYEVGDVAMLRGDSGLLLHRIVRIDDEGVTTRGDGMSQSDPGVAPYSALLGKVIRVSGAGFNFHLKPPFSRLLAAPRFADYVVCNRVFRTFGKLLLYLLR